MEGLVYQPPLPTLETWPAASPVPGPGWFAMDSQLSGWSPGDPCLLLFVYYSLSKEININIVCSKKIIDFEKIQKV